MCTAFSVAIWVAYRGWRCSVLTRCTLQEKDLTRAFVDRTQCAYIRQRASVFKIGEKIERKKKTKTYSSRYSRCHAIGLLLKSAVYTRYDVHYLYAYIWPSGISRAHTRSVRPALERGSRAHDLQQSARR